jgi:signal transduction histidine kinase
MLVNGGTAISNTHEWCAPQIEPQIDTLQNIPVSIMPWWMNHLHNLQSIHIPRVSELPPEAVAEREILEAQSIKSLLVVPLVWNGHLVGFLGFDSVRRERVWHHESIAPMEMLGNIIVNALNRKEGELALRASQAALQEINSTLEEKVLERTRQLRDAQLRLFLQERMVSIGQLAAGIAHELNNPIGFIFNNFNALKENMDVVKEVLAAHKTLIDQAESLPLLSEQVQTIKALEDSFKLDLILEDLALLFDDSREGFSRVTAIINSMRDFSRTDRVGELEEFNVNRGIETTLVIARNEYKYVCDVETDLGDLPDIPCIPNQINQVFLNIIVNAAHAIASQNRSGKGTIKIVTSADATTVSCRISDDGPGIPEEISNRIFDPFFTTKAPGKGTGLGLSISYDIVVNKHKGDITVESRVGQGTSFFIRLPRATPPKDGPLT